jgi:hypothetical protein
VLVLAAAARLRGAVEHHVVVGPGLEGVQQRPGDIDVLEVERFVLPAVRVGCQEEEVRAGGGVDVQGYDVSGG